MRLPSLNPTRAMVRKFEKSPAMSEEDADVPTSPLAHHISAAAWRRSLARHPAYLHS